MKIIFLDIDGVLNSIGFHTKQGTRDLPWPAGHLDPAAVQVLNKIIARTQALIVVSSTWRIGKSRTWLQETLNAAGLTGTVLGKTDSIPGPRGAEIRSWLELSAPLHRLRFGFVTHYAVIDDDTDMAGVEDHFVHIDADHGLTDKYVDRICTLLGCGEA